MIPKGSQRAGGQQLATHLLNEFDNERVHVLDVRGAMARDLHGAFAEWRAHARGTRCRKYLYSLSINPDPDQGPLTREQYLDFIGKAEQALGLENQPRAVVFHVKHGREHCHTVWSRIDVERMRAVQLSHDRPKLQTVVREFAREYGLELPAGLREKDARRFESKQKRENLQEKQQEERTGITKADRVREITAAWLESRDARGLVQSLEKRGYLLARGDRRAYVVIDRFGEIFSLTRYIEGVKTKAVRDRLSRDLPLERLPDPAGAKEFARKRRNAKLVFRRDFVRAAEVRRAELVAAHSRRRAVLAQRQQALEGKHAAERSALREAHQDIDKGIAATRLIRRPRGLVALLVRVTGIQALVDYRHRKEDRARGSDHARQVAALERRHNRERQEMRRHERALARVENRELRSLATTLRREHLLSVMHEPSLDRDRVGADRIHEKERPEPTHSRSVDASRQQETRTPRRRTPSDERER